MGVDERHYNINKLNRLFGIASLVLLSAVGFLFFSDYNRKWKDYQTQFQALEIEKTRVKFDSASHQLQADPEYQKLQEDLKAAQQEYHAQCGPAHLAPASQEIKKLTSRSEILKQQYRVIKARLDAEKFKYEEIAAHKSGDVKVAEIRYKSTEQKVKELNRSIETLDAQIAAQQKVVDACAENLKQLEKKDRALSLKAQILKRKLAKIDPNEMSLTSQFANIIRNLPIIDLANPTQKIQQVVLNDVREDNNFTSIPKVDRCTTCHLGIDNPDYKDAAQPLRTHPNLELFVSKDSPHSLEEFGCTVCHDGRGRGTDFNSSAHTPSSEEQRKEWEKKYGYKEMHHWEKPMLPKPHVQAGCFKCHEGQSSLKGAEQLNLGLNLIERAGCYSCHNIEKYKDWPKPGPDLTHISAKTDPDWTYRWLTDPHKFKHNTWMPSFFGQSNNSDPESRKRSEQEIHAIVAYLFQESKDLPLKEMPFWGDPKKGEELVASIGCLGCHNLSDQQPKGKRTRDQLNSEHGPSLSSLGSKTSKVWIYDWLKDPKRYHPKTKMPNLRLSDNEAADIAAYLTQDKTDEKFAFPIPAPDEQILKDIVKGFLLKDATQAQADAKLAQMDQKTKLHYAGQKLISQYGCYSCHEIKGFQGFKPIGTDLTEEGSKPTSKLDFGFIDIEHTKQAWFEQKLKDPRIFDKGKIKAPDEKLRMPNYNFTEDEVQAITTAILGFVKDKPGKSKPRTPDNDNIARGQTIVRQYNCQGCHVIEHEGGTIQKHTKEWLIKYQEKDPNEAQSTSLSFSPPNLVGEGKKVQSQWLFDFIHDPSLTIRPWLKTRMPTYNLSASEINALLKYFNSLDGEEFPFTEHVNTTLSPTELTAAQKLFGPDYFDCAKCHIVGDKMPAGAIDSWAPNFALAAKRLKPEWIIDWIKNPPAILPGTKMPAFFDPQNYHESGPTDILDGNEEEQIRVLRNYVMSISTLPQSAKPQAAPTQAATPQN